jgi:hypothetical protein
MTKRSLPDTSPRLTRAVLHAFCTTISRFDEQDWQRLCTQASAAGSSARQARAVAYRALEATPIARRYCALARKQVYQIVNATFGTRGSDAVYQGRTWAWNILAALLVVCHARDRMPGPDDRQQWSAFVALLHLWQPWLQAERSTSHHPELLCPIT